MSIRLPSVPPVRPFVIRGSALMPPVPVLTVIPVPVRRNQVASVNDSSPSGGVGVVRVSTTTRSSLPSSCTDLPNCPTGERDAPSVNWPLLPFPVRSIVVVVPNGSLNDQCATILGPSSAGAGQVREFALLSLART